MRISENFTIEEFTQSETAKKYGIDNTIPDKGVLRALIALVGEVLQPLRKLAKKPLKINSGYRCPELNAKVGGVATSQHTKGEAADVASDNPYKLAKLAKEGGLPFDQMILYPRFVHFSHKCNGAQRNQILYNKLYTGKKL